MATDNIDAWVTIRFRLNSVCSDRDLDYLQMSLSKMVEEIIYAEGIHGCLDDEYEIIKVERIDND
jgi:hypothetical protein